jgi:hypothetical protein
MTNFRQNQHSTHSTTLIGDWEMRTRIVLFILVLCLISLSGISLAAKPDHGPKPNPGPGPNQGVYEPKTKFWMEKFQGGGPGQEGNVLMAVGQGFTFQHATLDHVEKNSDDNFTTTYIGGELTLNSAGPWAKKMKGKKPFRTLKASDITATNVSTFHSPTGTLKFTITFGGDFDNADFSYCARATYEGVPQIKFDDDGKPVFQRGLGPDDFRAWIAISDPNADLDCAKVVWPVLP